MNQLNLFKRNTTMPQMCEGIGYEPIDGLPSIRPNKFYILGDKRSEDTPEYYINILTIEEILSLSHQYSQSHYTHVLLDADKYTQHEREQIIDHLFNEGFISGIRSLNKVDGRYVYYSATTTPELKRLKVAETYYAKFGKAKANESIIFFREHRGSLVDSLQTTVEVKTLKQLHEIVNKINGSLYREQDSETIIEKYGKGIDERTGWDTYIVTSGGYVLGFLSDPLTE